MFTFFIYFRLLKLKKPVVSILFHFQDSKTVKQNWEMKQNWVKQNWVGTVFKVPILQLYLDLYFLDPAWVCRLVSSVTKMVEIRNQVAESGFIEKAILADYLFKAKAIPNEHHNQILRLLEVLEVVIEDRKGRYFIPG